MNDKRPIFHIDLSFVESLGILVFLALVAGVVTLALGAKEQHPAALMTLGAVIALVLVSLGVFLSLAILWIKYRMDMGRAEQERRRELDDTRENVAIIKAMQGIQNQQNSMLLRQAREATRSLPAPGAEAVDIDALFVDDGVFSELED